MLTEQKVGDFDRGISTAIGRATMVLLVIVLTALVQGVRYGFTNNDYLLLLCGSVISIVAIIIYSKLPPPPSNLPGVQKSVGITLVVWISGLLPLAFLVYVTGYRGLWSLAELRHGISMRPFVKALVFGYLGWSAARHFAKIADLVRQREESLLRKSEAQQIAVWGSGGI